MRMAIKGLRTHLCVFWIVGLVLFVACSALRPGLIDRGVHAGIAMPVYGVIAYLLLGSLRGFALIPSTHLLILAIPFFPPAELFLLTLIGIAISSTSIYFLSKSWEFDRYFEANHGAALRRLVDLFQTNQLRIIVGWSFFPLVPTDLICYVSGILKVPFARFILAVLLGEGAICAIYVFLGHQMLTYLRHIQ
jgi:uncharacterized membrane protein YdjX (TVP38/TMEM64 family)